MKKIASADPAAWWSPSDPSERLEAAPRELYRCHAHLEPLLENVQRDAAVMPVVAEMNAHRVRYLEAIRDVLGEAWPACGGARTRLRQAVGHGLEPRTWRCSFAAEGARPMRQCR